MPKVSTPLPPRLSRKRFSPFSSATDQDVDVLLRFKHVRKYQLDPTTFNAAVAICQLQATLADMRGVDIDNRPSKRSKVAVISSTGSIMSTLASSLALSPSSSPSRSPFGHERPSLLRDNPRRYHEIDSAYGSSSVTATSRHSEETWSMLVLGRHKIPTIKISLKSLEKLRKSLHNPPVYRMIDPNYGSKKRKRN